MKSILPIVGLGILLAIVPALAAVGPGAALSFNGPNQYLSASLPSLPYNYTISAWVYLRSGGTDSNRLGVLTGVGCGDSVERMIHSTTASSTDPQYLELGRCGVFTGDFSTNTVPLNQWVHIAVTVSYVDKYVNYYINGKHAGGWSGASCNMYVGPTFIWATTSPAISTACWTRCKSGAGSSAGGRSRLTCIGRPIRRTAICWRIGRWSRIPAVASRRTPPAMAAPAG